MPACIEGWSAGILIVTAKIKVSDNKNKIVKIYFIKTSKERSIFQIYSN